MPDEALQASLQGKPRQAPDFSPLALAHLQSNCLALHQLIKQYRSQPSQAHLDEIIAATREIRQTLELLNRFGAVLVTTELSLLLEAMAQNQTVNDNACIQSLVVAGERLAGYVAHLQNPGAIDSPLPLLPVINNCRACRNEDLLSEMLLVVSGMDLPDVSSMPLPSPKQINTFAGLLKVLQQPMQKVVDGWFADQSELHKSLPKLADMLAKLSKCCAGPTSLQLWEPLFDSAEVVCHSVLSGALDNNAALHQLLTQLETLRQEYCLLKSDDAQAFAQVLPERLLLNFLYYVALSTESSDKADSLRHRFDLDRLGTPAATTLPDSLFNGVDGRLADSVRDAVEHESEALRVWLDGDEKSTDDLARVRKRLVELEAALMLLGAHESKSQIGLINDYFAEADIASGPANFRASKQIYEALGRLGRATNTELKAVRADNTNAQQSDLESIIATCLSEAQLRLSSIEEDVISLFGERTSQSQSVTVQQTNAKLAEINSALQVLPMPEVSPLIAGVQSFISRHEETVLSQPAMRDLATVIVSLGYYLNSLLQPNGASGQLLLEAEEALLNLDMDRLEANDDTLSDGTFDMTRLLDAASHHSEYDLTLVDHEPNTEVEDFIDVSLQQMNVISNAVYELEQARLSGKSEQQQALRNEMIQAYELLHGEAVKYKSTELEVLSKSNVRLLNSNNDSLHTQALLEESVAVLPQLINQFHSSGDKVFDLQALLDSIDEAAVDDLTLAMDVQGILDQSASTKDFDRPTVHELDDTSALTQSLSWESSDEFERTIVLEPDDTTNLSDTNFLDVTADDVPVMTLDNTLEQVFYRECDQHILSLRNSVGGALAAFAEHNNEPSIAALNLAVSHTGASSHHLANAHSLPNKELLRALHTLTGSAQTVDAQGIIAIAQPLQKAALHKQRNGDVFDRDETKYIGELIDVLELRLAAMEAEEPFADDNNAVMTRLRDFVAHSAPWVPERKPGLQLNNKVGAIETVFQEEARELLDVLRSEATRLSDKAQRKDAIDKILRCLHTIKGSARMAGQVALADRAHALEDEIKLVEGPALDSVVQNGLGELQTLMLVEKPVAQSTDTPKQLEPMVLSEASFENMFALASRATVSQAKLGESMLRLREAYTDIESTSARLQRLPHEHTDLNSAAVAEMLSDLESARRTLADVLSDAEAEHTQGLRADSALHQTLIRAQLVNFSQCQARLQHTAIDAANETGKSVDFVLSGAEMNIDKMMFRKLMTPLEHLVRNAVVHGIETEAERTASGKSASGRVAVDVKIDGTDVLIEVSDDGAGIDRSRVQALLDKRDSVVEGSADGGLASGQLDETLLDILTTPGFTTHSDADQLSGRGLGLSTVKQLIDALDGTMQLGVPNTGGTVFSLRLPQKIRINQVVLVEHQAHYYAIPVNFIHTVSDEQYDLTQPSIHYNSTSYDCCSLDAIIKRDIATDIAASVKRVVLMAVHGQHIALLVDRVIGYREIIAQPLGAQLSQLRRYLGGAVLADGRAVLIPDFNRLIDPTKSLPSSNWSAANTNALRRTALIVDDSITMRTAAERMLLNFSIEPSIARDGAEAVELISQALPDVLLVDIDMPRMNGFDFLRHLRVLHPEHEIPVVMISTRDTDKDRNQARKLGAMDYLVKPYTESQMRNALTGVGVLSADQSFS